jgi:hypothetical protein
MYMKQSNRVSTRNPFVLFSRVSRIPDNYVKIIGSYEKAQPISFIYIRSR